MVPFWLAHEMLHQEFSGGTAGATMYDAEEVAARSVESMVFHRAQNGPSNPIPRKASELLRESKQKSSDGGGQQARDTNNKSKRPQAELGYRNLKDRGYTYEMIVQHLTYKVLDELERKHLEGVSRSGHIKGFLE